MVYCFPTMQKMAKNVRNRHIICILRIIYKKKPDICAAKSAVLGNVRRKEETVPAL